MKVDFGDIPSKSEKENTLQEVSLGNQFTSVDGRTNAFLKRLDRLLLEKALGWAKKVWERLLLTRGLPGRIINTKAIWLEVVCQYMNFYAKIAAPFSRRSDRLASHLRQLPVPAVVARLKSLFQFLPQPQDLVLKYLTKTPSENQHAKNHHGVPEGNFLVSNTQVDTPQVRCNAGDGAGS